jgi:hypothetical protein
MREEKVMILGITGIPEELEAALNKLMEKHNIAEYFTLGTWDGKRFVGEVPDNASHYGSGVVIHTPPPDRLWRIKSVITWNHTYLAPTADAAMQMHMDGNGDHEDSWVVSDVPSMAVNCAQGTILDKTV